jgi:hypothetical protein
MTLTLYDVADVTGSVTVNGSGLPVTLSVPGQNADVTVAGTTGQSIRIPVTTPGASACATVRLLRADNVTSVGSIFSCGGTITLPSTTLPATETYHVILDLPGAAQAITQSAWSHPEAHETPEESDEQLESGTAVGQDNGQCDWPPAHGAVRRL